jgi:hypothetical protein
VQAEMAATPSPVSAQASAPIPGVIQFVSRASSLGRKPFDYQLNRDFPQAGIVALMLDAASRTLHAKR